MVEFFFVYLVIFFGAWFLALNLKLFLTPQIMLRFSALLKKPWTGLQSYWKNQSQESDYDESIAKLCIFGSNNSLWEKRKKSICDN